jgi:hypothetical protein
MLVDDIELVEDSQLMVRWLRPLVWLHLIEEVPQFLGDARDRTPGLFKKDWERKCHEVLPGAFHPSF